MPGPAGESGYSRVSLVQAAGTTVSLGYHGPWSFYRLLSRGGLNARSRMAPYQVTSFEAPGYVTADLMAEYSVGDLGFKLNVSNLTNNFNADLLGVTLNMVDLNRRRHHRACRTAGFPHLQWLA